MFACKSGTRRTIAGLQEFSTHVSYFLPKQISIHAFTCQTVGNLTSHPEASWKAKNIVLPVIERIYLTESFLLALSAYQDLVPFSDNSIFEEANITLGVVSQNALSFLRVYYDRQMTRIYPFLTAIINVDAGRVTGIAWDDACVFCGGGECDEITFDFNGIPQTRATSGQPTGGCFVPEETCNTIVGNSGTECDIILYVVWTGTDVDGKAFQSSASRFSAFPAQEIRDRLSRTLPQGISGVTGTREL
jgi:hypothetical protein